MQVQGFNPAIPFLFVREVLQGLEGRENGRVILPVKGRPATTKNPDGFLSSFWFQ